MYILPRPDGVVKAPPPCPVCEQPAIHWAYHNENGVTVANFLCGGQHGWLTKWVAA